MKAEPAGILLIDKPEGPTSHDVVAAVRRALRTRRVGHAGTLDPFASGLLLVCIGHATRLAEYATRLDKTYTATLRLGEATDTDDLTGTVSARSDGWRDVDEQAMEAVLTAMVGEQMQVPPVYSAKKIDGQRSHRLARRGAATVPAAARVRIHAVALTRFMPPDAEFAVTCSSGTYLRAIARDAGERLGCHAHLRVLRRTAIGSFRVEAALPLDALEEASASSALLPPAAAVAHLPQVELSEADARRIRLGQRLPAPAGLDDANAAIAVHSDRLVAVVEVDGGIVRPRKVFAHD